MEQLFKFENKLFSSIYLVDQINIFRSMEGNRKPILHKNLLAKIKSEFNELNILPVDYIDAKGEARKSYYLTEKQSLIILMSESKFVRNSVANLVEKQNEEIQKLNAEIVQLKIEAVETQNRFLQAQNDRLWDKDDNKRLYR